MHFRLIRLFAFCFCLLTSAITYSQAPANDSCSRPSVISIANAGYALGIFNSDTVDISNATVETGEFFPAAIFVAGQDKKSIWFRFTLPTIRSVRVTLSQPGVAIAAGNAGFSVYKTTGCLPGNPDLSTKLTPIATFGNSLHPCADAGEYLVQVSSNLAANGSLFIQIELSGAVGAQYDNPAQSYAFGTAGNYARNVDFNTECLSLDNASEVCNGFLNPQDFNKSAWFTFTVPAYYDYMSVLLSGVPGRPFNASLGNFGYRLYRGDALTQPVSTLITLQGCDSLRSDGYYAAYRMFRCGELIPGTTYTIQLFFHIDFKDDVRLGIYTGGAGPTNAPEPVIGSVTAPNAMGVLPASPDGTSTSVSDVFGCNSRLSNRNCPPAAPDTGVLIGNQLYTLASYFTFSLSGTSAVTFYLGNAQCGPAPVMRLFRQPLNSSCTGLDTANIIDVFASGSRRVDCMPAGDYSLQVLGFDTPSPYYYFNCYTATGNYEQCLNSNLGSRFNLGLNVYTLNPSNRFSLASLGAYDTINQVSNVMAPLTDGGSFTASADTFGCLNTLRPHDTTCAPGYNKVIYRQFNLADSGIITFSGFSYPFGYKVYQGDAGALAAAQNLFNYPDTISGLSPKSLCMDYYTGCYAKRMCLVPGTYTLTSFAGDGQIGAADRPALNFNVVSTVHHSPDLAQDMGSIIDSIGPSGGTRYSDLDYWSCRDNADTINGYAPCVISGAPATKAIYRQFYLKEPALVSINDVSVYYCANYAFGSKTLFKGRATDGLGGLIPLGNQWNCFHNASTTNGCTPLDSGWYTLVSYGVGPSFEDPFQGLNNYGGYGSYVGYQDQFTISITIACRGPQFNRPNKASVDTVTGQPYLIQWLNRIDHTPAYPHTDTTYVLQEEFFNCTLDTPFASHPLNACAADVNRVAYYVFRTTQEAYVQIDTRGYTGVVYDRDVRTDSLLFTGLTPVQPCLTSNGNMQICRMRPGTYTLVIFARDANSCSSVQPIIYIDKTGYSRFDFAKNAYDFGLVAPDSVYHYGKAGDVNPLNASRKPSNDFFYCTTGAFSSDPTESACDPVNSYLYNSGTNVHLWDSANPPSYGSNPRRNLWYTFVVNQGGYVRVKVENKTIGKGFQYRFAVYRSNVNANLPFSTVQSTGQVDSTTAQGLTYITRNESYYYCFNAPNEISFYRDPCNASTDRYYIVVDNPNSYPYEFPGMKPNSQVEVSVLVDSVTLVRPKFDHYYQANNLGAINTATVTRGAVDNYSCATRDLPDPEYVSAGYAQKTLWYKFSTTLSGDVRYRIVVNGSVKADAVYEVQLLRQTIPGDSTSTGLLLQNSGRSTVYDASTNSYWATTCISPGTYYLFLTGYNQLNEYVYPEVQVIEQLGDYCSRPVATQLNGPGTSSAPMLVNCHTIGTDYGEFGPQLTCPVGAATDQYKSSWFRLDITGTDVLDVTTYLSETTNASPSEIKYRLMTGNCGAMQEQSCVLDALTQNTYECLIPGQSYYVQVFTPLVVGGQAVTGNIVLQLSSVKHADTCAPLTSCLASANFTTAFDCTTDRGVKFVNFSTYGTAITYRWNFGYNNQTSTAVSPTFIYPASANSQNYTVKLVVTNTSCGKSDSITRLITVPGRPLVNLGADRVQCNGQPVTLNATSFTGATYLWQDGSVNPTFMASAPGNNSYSVTVTYNNCISRDTVNVLVNPVIKNPTRNFVLCAAGDSVLLDAFRPGAQSYAWNNGATSSSLKVGTPGTYWVNVKYGTCVVRDSFIVGSSASLRPLGRDTTVCLRNGNYLLDATTTGATGYLWQNGSTASTFSVSAARLYWVDIRFASCTVRDSVRITDFPAPLLQSSTASICSGNSYTLPWGTIVSSAGTYRDTLRFRGGCDSVYRIVSLTLKPKPALGADKSVSICRGASLSLSSQYTTTGLTAVWTFNGNPVTANLVNSAGVYQLVATNAQGCSDTALLTLVVNNKPSLGADSAVRICPYFTADLTVLFNTATLTPAWTFNGNPVANPASVSAAGNYRLIATNSFTCSDTAFVNLIRLPKPVLGPDKTAGNCPGFSSNLTALYNLSSLNPAWTLGGQPIPDPVAANAAGSYQLIALNSSGCADTAVVTLSLYAKPSLGNDTAIIRCSGFPLNLNSLYTTAGLTTNWTINGSAVANASAVYGAGLYSLIVRNASGCEDTASVRLTVNPKPALGRDTTISICPGFSANLNTLYATVGLTAAWTLGGVAVADPSSITSAGNYRLIATNGFGCADTALVTVSLYQKPSLGSDRTAQVCPGFTANLASLYNTGGLVSRWSFAGQPVPDSSRVGVAGVYSLFATNTSGCSDTALTTLSILAKPSLGADTTLHTCPGFPVNLTNTYATAGLSTSWSFNNQPVGNPTAVTNVGAYTLIVANASGCRDTASTSVVADPKPALGRDTAVSICPGFSFNLNSLYATAGLTASWTLGNNPVSGPSQVGTPGTYRLIVTNGFGCSDTADVVVSLYAKPSLGPDKTDSFCPGFTVDIATRYSTTGLTTDWSLNGIPVLNPARIDEAGNYRLMVSNASGCRDTAFVSVTRNPKPSLGNDKAVIVCAGIPIDLNTQFDFSGLTSMWTINGSPVSNPASVLVAGTYRAVASNSSGCSDTATVLLTVNPKPSIGADTAVRICPGAVLNLVPLYNTVGLQAVWTLNGAVVANPNAVATDGAYRLEVTNAFGCRDTAFVNLATDVFPTLIVTNPPVRCYPALGNLTAPAVTAGSSSGIQLSYWKNSDGTGVIADPSAVTAGLYHIRAVNATGCATIRPVTVNIRPLIRVDAGRDMSVCRGSQGLLQGRVSDAEGPVTYLWTPPVGLASASAATTVVNPDSTRTYVLNVRDNYGCGYSVSDSVMVTVPPPVLAFAGNDTTVSRGIPALLTASGGVAYHWYPEQLFSNPIIAATRATLTAERTLLVVKVSDAAGCFAYDTVEVRTLPGVTYYVPNAFSPNGDGLNDLFRVIPVGIATTDYFRIFNRYGETVFLTTDIRKGWDGTYKGVPQPVGNYVWLVKGLGGNGKVVEMRGNVVLVR